METFVLRAPDFEIEVVGRSIAFGAALRGFQERFGLVESRQEYGFVSLHDLTTFVRRIYLGGGAGSGGEGPAFGGDPEPGGDNNDRRSQGTYGEFLNQPKDERFDSVRKQLDESITRRAFEILHDSAEQSELRRHRFFFARIPGHIAWLPRQYVRPQGMPKKIRNFNDVMFFFAAERNAVASISLAEVLPLLLATAIYFSDRREYYFEDWREYDQFQWWARVYASEYAKYIVDWLPFDALPAQLESTLESWNTLTFNDQRMNPGQG
ncbi:hypothetical protein HBO27_26460 [Pseudomonas koreensis]|nr:hypothetical protein [Pseudomonas koreensis]